MRQGTGRNCDIKVNVPVSGSLNDPKFELGEAIWTAIPNVLVNVVAAPFRAIGRLLTARLQATQRDKKLPSDAQAVAADSWRAIPLPSTDDQIAKLLEREPLPADRPAELPTRRLQAVQQALETAGGIPTTRLTAGPMAPGRRHRRRPRGLPRRTLTTCSCPGSCPDCAGRTAGWPTAPDPAAAARR